MATAVQDCAPHCKCMITGFLLSLSLSNSLSLSLPFALPWNHPKISFCVTIRQTLQFYFIFWTHSSSPTSQILLCSLLQRHGRDPVVAVCLLLPSIRFDRRVLCRLLFLWWKPAAIVQIHFVKGFEGQKKTDGLLPLLENMCNAVYKKAFCLGILWKEAWQL